MLSCSQVVGGQKFDLERDRGNAEVDPARKEFRNVTEQWHVDGGPAPLRKRKECQFRALPLEGQGGRSTYC